jgi:lipoprotein-releasing system permease protein
LGTRNGAIKRIFLNHALYILVLGLGFGNLLGLGLAWLQSEYKIITLAQETYYLAFVPIEINLWMVLAVNIGTVIICMMALLLPVRLISKIEPVKAIKFN